MAITAADILTALKRDPSAGPALCEKFRAETYRRLWREHPELYRAFAAHLVHADHPFAAIELLDEGLRDHPSDLELRRLRALTFDRVGSLQQFRDDMAVLLDDVAAGVKTHARILCQAGRMLKHDYFAAATDAERREAALASATYYKQARSLHDAAFETINAATMMLLAGEPGDAAALAKAALAHADREMSGGPDDRWAWAVKGEALLILEERTKAADAYRQALACSAGRFGDIESMRRNVLLLQGHIGKVDEIVSLLAIGTVVAFSGHLVDDPGKPAGSPARFPDCPALADAVKAAIAAKLDALKAGIGYCSAANGCDLLFAEALLERKGELHVVLPFDRSDFLSTSVDYGYDALADWKQRFEAVMERAHVHFATDEAYLGDDELYAFANGMIQGLALTHAARIGLPAAALGVFDAAARGERGGTADFIDIWARRHGRTEQIPLDAIRRELGNVPPRLERESLGPPQRVAIRSNVRRSVKTMLFADVKGFSKLREQHAPLLFPRLIELVARLIGESNPPAFANTWGDGLFVVFESVQDGADFAMRLIEQVPDIKWDEAGCEVSPSLRVGIHAGPVYRRHDLVIGRPNFFGRHVNLAARIEPVARDNCVYASEQFAAMLATEHSRTFACEYIGRTTLPKNSGSIPLYRLRRTAGSRPQ